MSPTEPKYDPPAGAGHRFIPTSYQGKIDPNYYCRGWNAKRDKYCGARAGQGTDHPGEGRCLNHGGTQPLKHGRYRRLKSEKFLALVEEFERDPDPMDVFPELHLMRAIVADWINRYQENIDALLAWHHSFTPEYQAQLEADREAWLEEGHTEDDYYDAPPRPSRPRIVLDITDANRLLEGITRTVARMEKMQNANAVSRVELLLLTQEMGRVVERCNTITDAGKRIKAIQDGWLAINTRVGVVPS